MSSSGAKRNPWRTKLNIPEPSTITNDYVPLGTAMTGETKRQNPIGDYPLTDEQDNIRVTFKGGQNGVVGALAGTGKTTCLRVLCADNPTKDFTVVMFNRSVADEGKRVFPRNASVSTMHSLAFRALGFKFKNRIDNARRINMKMTAEFLNLSATEFGGIVFEPWMLARFVMDGVGRFCKSLDNEPMAHHVPFEQGMEDFHGPFADYLTSYMRKAWADLTKDDSKGGGKLRFNPDVYLKLWAMTNPHIQCDVIMQDEAQDSDPIITYIVQSQKHAQQIMVGDENQAIYGWRGAVDAMSKFECDWRLPLTKSFRFGPAVAAEANKWLELLDSNLRVEGFEKVPSVINAIDIPDAILCRSNGETVAQALQHHQEGRKVAFCGGKKAVYELKQMTESAQALKTGGKPTHRDFVAFKNWQEVIEYSHEPGGKDLAVWVKLIDDYGVPTILGVCDNAHEEEDADIVVSTAHKAKGREWDKVKIASDFREPTPDEGETEVDPGKIKESKYFRAEMMLAYVSVTRAKLELDPGSLQWVNRMLDMIAAKEASARPE